MKDNYVLNDPASRMARKLDWLTEAGNRLAELLRNAPKCVCETPTNHCRGCRADDANAKAIAKWKEVAK